MKIYFLFLKIFTPVFLLMSFCSFGFSQVTGNNAVNQTITATHYFSDPAISPDASEIAFVSGGDIWTVSSK